mmetsp:Transcript_2497/g.8058  ORF Transcript_2497/g.8058 Transcript_2497/m.8058 type:complete len:294 (-) Transcript_2497:52-933(-)
MAWSRSYGSKVSCSDGLNPSVCNFFDFSRKDGFGRRRRVDARRLDRNHKVTALLQKVLRVETNDTRLIRLRYIGKDGVNHANQHAVFLRVTRVFDDGNDIGALLRHVDQIATRTVGKLYGVYGTFRTDEIRAVRHRGTRRTTEVQQLGPGLDVNVVETAENARGNLRTERVPHAVLRLRTISLIDRNTLFTVHTFTDNHVSRHERILLAPRDEDAFVTMLFDDDFRATLHAASTAASTAASAAASTATASAASSTAASTAASAISSSASATATATATATAAAETASATAASHW